MLNVLTKTFPIGEGNKTYVGCARPSAAPGITVHSLNKISDIYAANAFTINGVASNSPSGNGALFDFTGGTFAPSLGAMGSFLVGPGGGHGGWYGNDVFRYDIATALFSRVTSPLTTLWWTGSTGNFADNIYAESYADSGLTTTLQNQPGAAHGYDHGVYLPAGVGGTGASGGLLTVRRMFTSPNAGSGKQTHILDLATGVWSRFATNLIQVDPFGGGDIGPTSACYDTVRQKIYLADAGWNIQSLDIATKAWAASITTTAKVSGKTPAEGTFRYMPSLDLCIFCFQNGDGFALLDPNNLAAGWTVPPSTGSFPGVRGGWDWDDTNKRGIYYSGDGSKSYSVLTPPTTNPKTNSWTVTTLTLTGTTPGTNTSGTGHQSRFRWIQALNAALWIPSATSDVTKWVLN